MKRSKQLEFEEIQKRFDADYAYNQPTRERAASDLVFYHITHWDDALLESSNLQYRGEFDLLRKGKRDIIADMRSNPIQADFEPIDGTDEQVAELMDGLYRASCRKNISKEAFDFACDEQVVCGIGGWRLVTKYESDRMGNRNQVIMRQPIREFNSRVYFDCAAEAIDKADAKHCTILTPFTRAGYCELYCDLTGDDIDESEIGSDFSYPDYGLSFPWFGLGGEKDVVYVGEHYYRYKTKVTIGFYKDMFGTLQAVDMSLIEDKEELAEAGFVFVEEKEIEKYVVDKYIISGDGIIGKPERIAGSEIPVIPQYGERAFIQGVEYYEGIVKAARDPQILRDFAMSYLADTVARSPRVKPIYFPEQIQGYEFMHDRTGADDDLPYALQNRFDPNGNELPLGPVAQTLEQPPPMALQPLLAEMRMAVEDVVNPGLPNSISDPDLSGKALNTLTAMFDQQSIGYQENRKYSMRRDAEVFASMASEVYDTPRKIVTESANGNRAEVMLMEDQLDIETGEIKVLNDLTNASFEVYADIGKAYETSREEALDKLINLQPSAQASDPKLAMVNIYKIYSLLSGTDTQDIRDWAGTQLVLLGVRKPETEEEMAAVEQAAQQSQPDAAMALAEAEQMKAQNGAIKNQIDQYRAETDRIDVLAKVEETGANINYKQVQTQSMKVNDAMKLRSSVSQMQ